MSEIARQLPQYTVAEFLQLDLSDEWHHELIDGVIVSMAPPGGVHQVLHGRLTGHLFAALQAHRPECDVRPQAGIAPEGLQSGSWFEADLVVACSPPDPAAQGIVNDPILLIEILSPSNDRVDRRKKLPLYKTLGSLREIIYVESETVGLTVWRRSSDDSWTEEVLGSADTLTLISVPLSLPVATLYAGTGLRV